MLPMADAYHKSLRIAGGAAFGLYYVAGIVYFETFFPDFGSRWSFFLLQFAFFAGFGIWLLRFHFPKSPSLGLLPKIALPIGLLLVATAFSWLFAGFFPPHHHSPGLATRLFTHVALISLIPLILSLMLLQNGGFIADQEEEWKPEEAEMERGAVFRIDLGQSGKAFEIPQSDLLLVEAADNYCKVHFLKGGERQMELLRTKMKAVEEALGGSDYFFRCHRSYLVNGKMVESISGVSQAYKLVLPHGIGPVRVSRSFDISPLRKLLDSRIQSG